MTEMLSLTHDREDDTPVIIGVGQQLHLPELLDRHLGKHGLHQGLSNGTLTVGWLARKPEPHPGVGQRSLGTTQKMNPVVQFMFNSVVTVTYGCPPTSGSDTDLTLEEHLWIGSRYACFCPSAARTENS